MSPYPNPDVKDRGDDSGGERKRGQKELKDYILRLHCGCCLYIQEKKSKLLPPRPTHMPPFFSSSTFYLFHIYKPLRTFTPASPSLPTDIAYLARKQSWAVLQQKG